LQAVNAFTIPERGTGSGPNNFGAGDYGVGNDLNVPYRFLSDRIRPIEVTAQQISAREPAENLLSYNGDYSGRRLTMLALNADTGDAAGPPG